MSSRAVLGDHTVRQHMIAPIAIAWHRVHATTGAAGRIQRGAATLEITLRVVAAIALTDYLRGPPDPRVEQQLERLSRPSLGTWLGIAREALRAVRERTVPAPFVPEAVDAWFDAKGGPTPALRRLDELVALRNQLQHGGGVGGESTDAAHAATLVEGLREVLASLSWLLRYRVFRVVDQQPTRAQTVRGRVQFFVGLSAGDPVSAEWTATLFPDAVYLCDPTAQAVLELSPLLWMLPEPSLGVERPFLVHAVHKSGDLVLNWDETGHSERRRIQGANGPVDWPTWLDERTSRDPVQANRDVAGTLTSPLGQATAGVTALDGRFTLGEHLGEGGMAVVYRAHDRLTDAEVAVKVLRPEVAADPEVRARFKREGATMAAMRHPRVLSGVTLGESADGSLYLAMPLYAGGTVADRLSAGKVTDDDRARWSRQLLEALVHLASMRVVHRDIKPSNLLLDDAGDLVLSDFGIALGARDARLTRTLTQLGSLAYMAPESRTGSVDSASDAWSAAVVLHELHTGELPRGRPGDGMPGPIGELTRSLGAIDPSERPSAANALAALDGQPGLLHPALIEGSNDERVLVVGALGGLMGALLLVVPLFTSQPASVIADWALPLSPAVAWSGWPLAVLGFGLVGASVGRRQFGEGPLPGALAGAIAALVAFSLGGAAPVAVAAQLHLVSPEVYAGANLVTVMADAVVGTLWGVFGGALALTAVGGAAGVLGAWWARPEGPPSKAVNDVRDHGGYLGGMMLLVHLVAAALGLAVGTMAESVLSGLPDAPGVALLAYGSELWLGLYFLLPALALTVMHHPLLRASLRSETRSERVYAWMHAVALVVMPWIGVLFSGMQVWSLVLAVCGLVGAAVVVDAWRSARGLGHPVWSQDPNPRISLWGAALLAVCALTATPMVVGAVFGMFAVSSIQALQGYAPPPDPARALDPVRELTLTLWLLALVWASVVAAVAWVAERPERRSRALAVLAGVAVVAALGVVSTSWQSLGGVWFVLLAVVVVGLTGGVYELIRVAAGRLRGAPPAWEWTVSAAFLAVSCLVFGVLYGPLFLGYRPWGSLDPADEVVGPDLGATACSRPAGRRRAHRWKNARCKPPWRAGSRVVRPVRWPRSSGTPRRRSRCALRWARPPIRWPCSRWPRDPRCWRPGSPISSRTGWSRVRGSTR
jgi:hypothetical protein